MNLPAEYKKIFPKACKWVKDQEAYILSKGVPLTNDQKIDAFLVGVKDIEKIRLLKVDEIPTPKDVDLMKAVKKTGLLSSNTIGITFGHGIYIKSDYWNERRLLIHELAYTMQYERYQGVEAFLKDYLTECLLFGYPNSSLVQEALNIEDAILERDDA